MVHRNPNQLPDLAASLFGTQAQRRSLPSQSACTIRWTATFAYTEQQISAIERMPEISGVYEIWQTSAEGKTAVYVGISNSVARRIREHASMSEPNSSIRTANRSSLSFCYAKVEGVQNRRNVERALWKLYGYRWNDRNGPQGGRYTTTLKLTEYFPAAYTIPFNGTRQTMTGVTSTVQLP